MPLHATDDRARTFRDLDGGAKVYYVRPNGNDFANDGRSEASAFKTVQRALFEMEKDFWNGYYVIDVTGCTIQEDIIFPQIRSGGHVYGPKYQDPNTGSWVSTVDSYGAAFRSAVNFRAKPQVVYTGGWADVGVQDDDNGRFLKFQSPGANWAVGEHKNHFLLGQDGDLLPIFDNSQDTLLVLDQEHVLYRNDRITIVAPGATFQALHTAQYLLDSLLGGYTFFGITFKTVNSPSGYNVDEWMKISHCPSIVFEACMFDGTDAWGRIRTGGSGLIRFVRCRSRNVQLRHVGGSYLMYDNIFTEGGTWSSGSIDNYDDQTTPVPSMLVMSGGHYEWGYYNSDRYGAQIFLRNLVIPANGAEMDMGGAKGNIEFCRIKASPLMIQEGCELTISGPNLRDLYVSPGSFVWVKSLNYFPDAKVGAVTVGGLGAQTWDSISSGDRITDSYSGAVLAVD